MYRFIAHIALAMVVAVATLTPRSVDAQKMPITTSSEEAREAYYAGLQFLDTSQPESARPLLERALERDPQFIMALNALRATAPTFKVAGEYLVRLQEMVTTAPMSEGERIFFDALAAGANGDRQKQLELMKDLVERYPADERITYQYALFFFGSNDAETVRLLRKALEINANFVPAYNIIGYSLRALGKDGEAETAFKKAIDLNPTNPNAYDSYAELLLKLGRFDESITYYDKALELEPMFPSAQVGVAANLILQGRHDVARQRLDRLYEVAPHDGMRSGVHWAKAVTYVDEGNMEMARGALMQNYALSEKGEDKAAMALDLTNIAAVQVESGDLDVALESLAQALDYRLTAPNQTPRGQDFARAGYAYSKGLVLIRQKEWEAAKAEITTLAGLAEKLGAPFVTQNVHELRGTLALAQGAHADALAELEQANATEVYNMYRMAQAYEGQGNLDQARAYYQYVITYHSPLNLNYSFVRHRAVEDLARLNS